MALSFRRRVAAAKLKANVARKKVLTEYESEDAGIRHVVQYLEDTVTGTTSVVETSGDFKNFAPPPRVSKKTARDLFDEADEEAEDGQCIISWAQQASKQLYRRSRSCW